jgi:hypothetical protein
MAAQIGQPLVYQQKWAFTVEIYASATGPGIVVAGFTKAGPLKQSMGVVEQGEGGSILPVDVSV